jgi:hypothetical protein
MRQQRALEAPIRSARARDTTAAPVTRRVRAVGRMGAACLRAPRCAAAPPRHPTMRPTSNAGYSIHRPCCLVQVGGMNTSPSAAGRPLAIQTKAAAKHVKNAAALLAPC